MNNVSPTASVQPYAYFQPNTVLSIISAHRSLYSYSPTASVPSYFQPICVSTLYNVSPTASVQP